MTEIGATPPPKSSNKNFANYSGDIKFNQVINTCGKNQGIQMK